MEIGERIKALREEKGMSQRELSRKSGVPATTLNQYERGKRRPRADILQRIAAVLGVSWYEPPPDVEQDERLPETAETAESWEHDILKRILKKNGTVQTFDMAIGAICKLIQVWSEWCRYDRFPSAEQEEEMSQAIASASILIDQLRISRGIEVEDMRCEILESLKEELNEEGSATNE